MKPFKLLTDNHGTLYEIPLILMGYGALCAIAHPHLQRILHGNGVAGFLPLLVLGLGVALYLGRMISVERVSLFGAPSVFWAYLAMSVMTVPFLWFNDDTTLATATLLAQAYGSFRIDFRLAERKRKEVP